MRRVLLIHYHFLPVHNVAVKHLLGYARYLPAFGWEPLVLTRTWTGLGPEDAAWGLTWEPSRLASTAVAIHRAAEGPRPRLRRARESDPWPLRKALTVANLAGGRHPDDFVGWIAPAVAAATDLIRRERIDVVLAYCPPETNVIVGSRVAEATGVPFVPFFGDLYGFRLAPAEVRGLAARLTRARHRRWMAPATAAAAVSPAMVEYVRRTYGVPCDLVLVGFEPREFGGPMPDRATPEDRPRLVVSHVGSLYPGDQRPEIFLDGVDRLLREDPDAGQRLRIRFIGSKCDDALRALLRERQAAHMVEVVPIVGPDAAIAEVRGSDALLAFSCTRFRDRHGTLSYPSKVFEAFGARRPVLVVPPDGGWVDALLARTQAGVAAGTPEAVATVLSGWLDEWQRTGCVRWLGDDATVAEFTHEAQAGALAHILSNAARRPNSWR